MSIEFQLMTALTGLSSKVAIDAIYYLLRLLRHRGLLRNTTNSLIVHGVPNEPTQEAVTAALRVLRQIEKEERVEIHGLTSEQVEHLVQVMDKVVAEIYERDIEVKVPVQDGAELLEAMRKSGIEYSHNK